jgi:putative Holliday junction resolvase
VGVARSDPDGLLAVPLETLARPDALSGIVERVTEIAPLEVIVGLPLGLSGSDTASTEDARAFATELAELVDVPVRLVDERLSTVQAHSELRAAGRSQKNQRGVVDQAAAVILLQHALDSERSQGVEPGHRIDVSGE